MRIFISWSGARSKAIALALLGWLPSLIPGIDIFHSEDIPKGRNWHSALIEALRDCTVGIFCVTPESLRSPWMLFEAGAMVQHGERPTLLTYTYGIEDLNGPLAHFQATRFERADTRRLMVDLASLLNGADLHQLRNRFDEEWPAFEGKVLATTAVPVQQLLPEFPSLFDQRKTFHEPFPDCSNTRWDDRLRRTALTHGHLSQPHIAAIFQSDPFLRQGYAGLLAALDRYDMHISSYLLERRDFATLEESAQRALEDARRLVVDTVTTLQRNWPPPVLAESPAFETEAAPDVRKMQIHAIEDRLTRGQLPLQPLRERRPEWALDRIAYYLACGSGLLTDVALEDLVAALETEEANARTRSLVTGLQPLYYAAECLDERMLKERPDPHMAARIASVIDEVQWFVHAHPGRDVGNHITRRIDSIRQKLTAPSTAS